MKKIEEIRKKGKSFRAPQVSEDIGRTNLATVQYPLNKADHRDPVLKCVLLEFHGVLVLAVVYLGRKSNIQWEKIKE